MGLDQIKLWHFFQINLVTVQFLALLTDSSPALHTSQDTAPIIFHNCCILDSTSFLNSSLKNPSHVMGQRRAQAHNLKKDASCLSCMYAHVLVMSCMAAKQQSIPILFDTVYVMQIGYYHCRMVTSYSSSTISLPQATSTF